MRPYHRFGVPFNNQFEYGPNESGPAFQAPFQGPFQERFQAPFPIPFPRPFQAPFPEYFQGPFPEGPNWQFGPPPPRGLLPQPGQFCGPETFGPGLAQTNRFYPYNQSQKKPKICKYFKQGYCRLDENKCNFLHDLSEKNTRPNILKIKSKKKVLSGVDKVEIASPATSSAINNNGNNLPMNYAKIETEVVQGKSSSAPIGGKAVEEMRPAVSEECSAELKDNETFEKLSKDNLKTVEFKELTITEIATTATSSTIVKKPNLPLRHPEIDTAVKEPSSSAKNSVPEGTKPTTSKESSADLKANETNAKLSEEGLSNEPIVGIKRERHDFDLDDELVTKQEQTETVKRIKTEEELPQIFFKDEDFPVFDLENNKDEANKNQTDKEAEAKSTERIPGENDPESKQKCDYCHLKVPPYLVVFKNDDIFILIKDTKPLVKYQFTMRCTTHIPSLMSARSDFLKRFIDYKRDLCSIFALKKTKLVFVEYYLPVPMKEKKHFDVLVFGIPEDDSNGFMQYFWRAIKSLNGEEDANQSTLIFKDLDHFRSIQKDVPKQNAYFYISFQEEVLVYFIKSGIRFSYRFAEKKICEFLQLKQDCYKAEQDDLGNTVNRATSLKGRLEDFIIKHP